MLLLLFWPISSLGAISIEMVTVGDPANPSDATSFGSVDYVYQIGKYELKNSEYSAFLNAVARTDPYALYDSGMSSSPMGGILQSGTDGSYTYSVKPGYENMPVVFVNYYCFLRFANWLHNGQPSTGLFDATTTEDGAYTFSGPTDVGPRNPQARYFLPSENEWYKAAYYDPTKNDGAGGYWLYPMRTDDTPYSCPPPGTAAPDPSKTGNFWYFDWAAPYSHPYNNGFAVTGDYYTDGSQNLLTQCGAYTQASSYYGTFDQGGNVSEMNEAMGGADLRCSRGGYWDCNLILSYMQSAGRYGTHPLTKWTSCGFRIAGIAHPPVALACPTAVTANNDPGQCYATAVDLGTPIVSGGTGSFTIQNDAPAQFPVGTTPVAWSATDTGGNTATCVQTVTVNDTEPPTLGTISAPMSPYPVQSEIVASADFTDNCGVHAGVWDWGDGSTSTASVTEANGSGSVSDRHVYASAGVYTLTLTVADEAGNAGQGVFQFVVIYDPSAGFVTGGGWLYSRAGAYVLDPDLAGQATFGFVSKYQKGAAAPTGQTQFQFQIAGFNFHSTAYDWLVIGGPKAQYKGRGTVNDAGKYGFILTATDGQRNGGGGLDKFRIKI